MIKYNIKKYIKKFAIIISKKDLAGMTMYPILSSMIKNMDDVSLYLIDEDTVNKNDYDIDADMFIYATRHSSKSGIPSLCVHTPGNWGTAFLGGANRTLCIAPANYIRKAYDLLREKKEKYALDFEVIQEVTHHGPDIDTPCIFIEIGSDKSMWTHEGAAKAVSETIVELIRSLPEQKHIAFGIGGLHHCPRFSNYIVEHDLALGHVCPKYALEDLDKEMIEQAISKTYPQNDIILVEWKGLGKYKNKVRTLLEGYDYKKI